MEINLTLNEIRLMVEPLKNLSNEQLPIKYSWRILQICENFETIVNRIEKFRIDLITKYGEKFYECKMLDNHAPIILSENEFDEIEDKSQFVSTNQRIEIKNEENLEKFYKEFSDLLSEEEKFEFELLDINDLNDVKMTTKDLHILKKLFKI